MRIEIHEESASELDAYAQVPIAFRVDRAFEVTVVDGGFGGFALRERPVEPPWTKDYDAIAGNPPTVLFSAGMAARGAKDSLANARATDEFTCNIVGMAVAEGMNQSAAELAHGESEFDFAGLTPEPSIDVKAPRVAEARASFECALTSAPETLGTRSSALSGLPVVPSG